MRCPRNVCAALRFHYLRDHFERYKTCLNSAHYRKQVNMNKKEARDHLQALETERALSADKWCRKHIFGTMWIL